MARRHHTRSRKKQPTDPLERLEQLLINEELLEVLQSLPSPDSWRFQQASESRSSTIRLFLGYRPKNDGDLAQSWACVIVDGTNLKPPVTFYDREHDRARPFPRSASSVLRKAEALQPPFCFLQYDPVDKTTGVRDMLCALILYGTLVIGADTCALQWDKFEESLCKALRYIISRDAYHQWQHEQKLATTRSDVEQKLATVRSGGSNQNHIGGVVRPKGGQMTVRPNTSLAKLRDELDEKKLKMVDSLPPIPMTLSPHSLGGNYFPFRMCIGSDPSAKGESVAIHAYLIHDETKPVTLKFLSHDDKDKVTAWTVDDLRKATLLEPFRYLNDLRKSSYGTGNGSSARTAKIRSLISYYFFLAENEGLIGNPLVATGESFAKRLCAAANELQYARLEGEGRLHEEVSDDTGEGFADADVPVPEPEPEPMAYTPRPEKALSSRDEDRDESAQVVRLATQPETMMDIAQNGRLHYQDKSPDVEPDQQRCSSSSELPTEVRAASGISRFVVEESLSPRIAPEVTQSIPTTPINHLDNNNVMGADRPGIEANAENLLEPFTNECVEDAPVASFDDKAILLPSPILPHDSHSISGTSVTDSETNLESEAALLNSRQANILVAQVMDNRPSTPEASVERETNDQPIVVDARDTNPDGTAIIDLCSDDEVSARPLSVFVDVAERTPEARRSTIDLTQISSEPRGIKRGFTRGAYLPDSDDDIIEETDGSGYRQALRGRRR
ncbi:hypothetical protein G6514_001641 [Epicoccum nigrum]|nr:hypothetical protein G6514_001641 [Epicoccum nigrum]